MGFRGGWTVPVNFRGAVFLVRQMRTLAKIAEPDKNLCLEWGGRVSIKSVFWTIEREVRFSCVPCNQI